MNRSTTKTCQIWPGFPVSSHFLPAEQLATLVEGSHRAGGDYIMAFDARDFINSETAPISDRVRAKLTTMLIEMRKQGEKRPMVDIPLIMRAINAPGLSATERANQMLLYLSEQPESIALPVHLKWDPNQIHNREMMEAAAASECDSTAIEVRYLVDQLREEGLVQVESGGGGWQVTLTVPGHQRVKELTSANTDSSQAFVAMWFDPSMNEVYEKAIKPAIEGAGYDAFIINRHDFTGKIEDEVIAQIRQSRFVVADFTHAPEATVRGSVYYEAGFAHGLKIPVIFMAREGSDLHFDTAHYNHIMWRHDDLPKLRKGLYDRIRAATDLGLGPRAKGE